VPALAYGLDTGKTAAYCVSDLGGGTFSTIHENHARRVGVLFQVNSTGGDAPLGGE